MPSECDGHGSSENFSADTTIRQQLKQNGMGHSTINNMAFANPLLHCLETGIDFR
jgi:hypothetical protein